MKSLFATVVLSVLTIHSFGQIDEINKGNWTVGGHIGGISLKSDRSTVLNPPAGYQQSEPSNHGKFSFGPWAAYFLLNGFAAGLDTKIRLESGSRDLGIGPLLFYYYPVSTQLALYAHLSTFWLSNKYSSFAEAQCSFEWGLALGLAWFMHQNIALNLGLGYSNESRVVRNSLPIGSDFYDVRYSTSCFGPKFGLQFFLPCGDDRPIER